MCCLTFVHCSKGSKWRDDDAEMFIIDDADRPASHILAAQVNKLTVKEQEKAVELFRGIDKDGNRQLARSEVHPALTPITIHAVMMPP